MARWAGRIAERAAGNPFFAEEIVRELAGRGVLRGEPAHTYRAQRSARRACRSRCRRLSLLASIDSTQGQSAR